SCAERSRAHIDHTHDCDTNDDDDTPCFGESRATTTTAYRSFMVTTASHDIGHDGCNHERSHNAEPRMPTHLRATSPATLDLLGLLEGGSDALITLDVVVRDVDGQTTQRCAPATFVANRERAVHALSRLSSHVRAIAAQLSCVTGVARAEIAVRVD